MTYPVNASSRSVMTSLLAGAAAIALHAMPAHAQENAQQTQAAGPAAEDSGADEIVVTGTLIRGVAPGGTNVIAISPQRVEETGATSVSQLLQTLPQFGSFNAFQVPAGGANVQTTNRPNLRNLPGFTTSGSSATLMLVNGHRVVGMGISSTSPDADIVPPGIIERLDIVPDGGSAIYGSDAVAGVINFITRKKVDGVEADARYGFADDYWTFDANVTAGRSWDGGSIYASYNYAQTDDLLGRDRDWSQTFPANIGLAVPVTALECPVGNVRVMGSTDIYGLPFTTATAASRRNLPNQCDNTDPVTIYPATKRHSVFAGFNQQLSDGLKFEVNAFYMNRKISQVIDPFRATLTIGPAGPGVTPSPFYASHTITSPTEIQTVYFSMPSVRDQNISLEAWGVDPNFTVNLGSNWQLRALASYGQSSSQQFTRFPNTTALTNAVVAGLINPYDAASSDARALALIADYGNFGKSDQFQFDGRVIVDGNLLSLPGGSVKLAAGLEYIREGIDTQKGNIRPGLQNSGSAATSIGATLIAPALLPVPIFKLRRTIKSAFGELVVPLFGPDNATTGFSSLVFSASGRYDHYSDVGGTFNPKLGVTWKPVDWIAVRGAWGKSFAAPSLVDSALAEPPGAQFAGGGNFTGLVPTAVVTAAGYPAPTAGQVLLILLGSKPGIKPQTAKTWSVGIDLEPPIVPGLKLGLSYFNIAYNDLISIPPFTSTQTYFNNYQSTFIIQPTQAQIDAALGTVNSVLGTCSPQPSCVYIIEDARKQNLGKFRLSGLDFTLNYTRDTGFGSIDFNVGGTYELDRRQSASPTAPFVDGLYANASRLKLRSTLGGWFGNLRGQITWSHSAGYRIDPTVGLAPAQTSVDAFNVFDLFFKYNVAGEKMLKDLSFTLSVNNVFDADPPPYRGANLVYSQNGYQNGATVGRLFQFGISKKF